MLSTNRFWFTDANQGKWVPASAASLAVDVDLGYTAAPAKGTVTNTAGDDAELPLVNATNAGLMSPADFEKLEDVTEIGDGTLTIKDVNGDALGTFTANQVDDSEITIPATKWEEIEGNPITIGGSQPNNPSPGDIWIDTGDCPPTINIWDDCDDPGNPTWTPIGGGGGGGCVQGPVQITSSNGTELNSTLTAVGGNGVDEGATLTASYEWTGVKTGTGSSIVADVEGNYTVTASITCVDGSVLRSSAVWTVSDSYVGMVNNTPPVIAVVGGGVDEAYEGNSIYVVTNATVLNGEIPSIVETQWFKDGTADGTGSIYTIGAADEGAVITAKQLFRDLRNNELLSLASNEITIVERPADAITFTAVITDDGTPTGNTPGHVLTASATNIVGGTSPIEYAYQWKSGGVATVTTKTYTLVEGDVGKIITCDVTVAEPDGSNAEVRTATYAEVIEIAGTINKPTVLAPADGAGSGLTRDIVTDEITAVEGGGIDVCETDTIDSVDDTTDAPNVILTFPSSNNFDCFADGDVVQQPDVKIVGEPDSDNNTIVVDGGEWTGSDGSGTPGEQTTLVKETPYDTKLTVAGPKDLADMTGATVMTDGTGAPGPYSQTPYKLVTTDIESVVVEENDYQTTSIGPNQNGDPNTSYPSDFFSQRHVDAYNAISDGTALYDIGYFSANNAAAGNNVAHMIITPGLKVSPADVVSGIFRTYLYPTDIILNDKYVVGQGKTSDWTAQKGDNQVLDLTSFFAAGETLITSITVEGGLQTKQCGILALLINGEMGGDRGYTELTFPGDVSTNPDLQYFKPGDVVQSTPDDVKVLSTGYPDSNSMVVDGGTWGGEGTISYNSANGSNAIDPNNIFDGNENTFGTFTVDGSFIGFDSTGNNLRVKFILDKLHPDHKIYVQPKVNGGWTNSGTFDYNGLNYIDFDGVAAGTEIDTVFTMPDGYDGEARLSATGGNTLKDSTRISIYSSYSAGDTHVEYQTKGGQGDIVSVNTDDNTILLSDTGDRDNRWIAENKAATDFFVAGPQIVDDPLLTADVELESSIFSTTPDGVDSLKNIVWELNGVTQDAGLTNPYKPSGLALNTTYTVRVKHQGNSLADSAWSTSTTFTTGATRNLYTYYKERVELLETRLAGIEADEIVDDATDVTLLTAFANLVQRVEALENP